MEEVAWIGKPHLSLRYLLKLNVLIGFFLLFFSQDWKWFGPISSAFSSSHTVEVQKKHKNIWFTIFTEKDDISLLICRILPWNDLENIQKGEIYALLTEPPVALIFN